MKNDNTKILVLPFGWVLVGNMFKEGNKLFLERPSVIRVWGTSNGLGQIGKTGPTKDTVLDPLNATAEIPEENILFCISCEATKWEKHLK